MPLDLVIEFKRDVYQMALNELARFVPPNHSHNQSHNHSPNRYLRGSGRMMQHDDGSEHAPMGAGPVTTGHGELDSTPGTLDEMLGGLRASEG